MLNLLRFGMPMDCNAWFGIKRVQKNHFSAVTHKEAIETYLAKNTENQAILGPFTTSPIKDLCFSPLMSVPKEVSKRRVIVDFSFPPSKSINDGISKHTYLDFEIKFSLPSVSAMVERLNELGPGCLIYKRDLKGGLPAI